MDHDPNDRRPRDDGFPQALDAVAAALLFLTRIPLPRGLVPAAPPPLARVAWAFPLAGLAVGALGALGYALATALGLPPTMAAVAAVAAQLVATGALHEDGLADIADGFGGGAGRAHKLAIMRDSRIGTYGAAALALALFMRVAAFAALAEPGAVFAAAVAAGALSRAAMAVVMGRLAPARDDGLGAAAGRPDERALATGLAVAAGLAFLFLLPAGGFGAFAAALLGAGAGAAGIAWLAQRQIGGQTGDVLGAAQQISEIAALSLIVATIG